MSLTRAPFLKNLVLRRDSGTRRESAGAPQARTFARKNPMKRKKPQKSQPEQLELEDLIAETIDICIRMRSIRRKNLVFCPLRIRGWQTSEALRYFFRPARFDEAWLEAALQNIREAETVRDALIMTASYISDILDLAIEKNTPEDALETNYPSYCHEVVESISPDNSEEAEVARFCWKTAKIVLEAYDGCHIMNDWELREHLESALTDGGDLEQTLGDKESALFGIFGGCLVYLHGWMREETPEGADLPPA